MRSKIAKLSNLFEIMSTQPREFYGRVVTMVESRIDPYLRKAPRYEPVEWRALVDRLSECLGVNVEDTLREDELKQVEDEVVRGLRGVGVSARDIISILQAIKTAGALNADLEMQ